MYICNEEDDWYPIDYAYDAGIAIFANDKRMEAIGVLPSVTDNSHHESYSIDEALEAWENHEQFWESYVPNPDDRYKNSWIGISQCIDQLCEFGYQVKGIEYFMLDNGEEIGYNMIYVYHMFIPVRKGFRDGIA